jgi:ABC-2 type transport system ATP-binding protein
MSVHSPIAELRGVSMRYGAVEALRAVSLELRAGEAVAVLGPNSAGKTTALSLLTGLKRVQKGEARLFGADPRRPATRRRIGVTPQDAAFPAELKVGELLDFARDHYPDPADKAEIIEAFDLDGLTGRMAASLSGGQQRKLAVALAFIGAPDLVFLDEPTTGIDIASRQRMWDFITRYKQAGGALFLTTHYLEEAEAIADRIVLINEGRIIRAGDVETIRGAVNVRVVRFEADQAPDLPAARLTGSENGRHAYLSSDADESVRALVRSGLAFSNLDVLPASLERAVGELLEGEAA